MFKMAITFTVAACLAAIVVWPAQAQTARPIKVGGDPDLPACGSMGKVEGLDPKGDGFLAVKAMPSLKSARIDKLTTGKHAYVCDFEGDWYGIIYSPAKQDCNLTKPRRAGYYKGPCRWGWVHKRWFNPYAG
jgi:hypothetical protein